MTAVHCARIVAACAGALAVVSTASAVGGSLSTASGGVIGGGNYTLANGGFAITYNASLNPNNSWTYTYTITRQNMAQLLMPRGSHIIIELSRSAGAADIFNFNGPTESVEFGTFGPAPGNPGFPTGQSIYGLKINYDSDVAPQTVSFDSFRAPRWNDFYAKGGSNSFAYNTSLGVAVANAEDFLNPPVDANGGALFKILGPDTIPAPGAAALLALAGLTASRRRR
jgi:MYXO-CTERM domain-containing protein